jgi:hypothetical protein
MDKNKFKIPVREGIKVGHKPAFLKESLVFLG